MYSRRFLPIDSTLSVARVAFMHFVNGHKAPHKVNPQLRSLSIFHNCTTAFLNHVHCSTCEHSSVSIWREETTYEVTDRIIVICDISSPNVVPWEHRNPQTRFVKLSKIVNRNFRQVWMMDTVWSFVEFHQYRVAVTGISVQFSSYPYTSCARFDAKLRLCK